MSTYVEQNCTIFCLPFQEKQAMIEYYMGVYKTRNDEMTIWRSGTKDKNQSCKINVPLK